MSDEQQLDTPAPSFEEVEAALAGSERPAAPFQLSELEPHRALGMAIQQFGNACAIEAKGNSASRVAVAVIQLGARISGCQSLDEALKVLAPRPAAGS